MSVTIHGKEYITVNERVQEAHEALEKLDITTEVLYQSPVVVKATVVTKKGTFTGISAANPTKPIEKMSPYEVAETSAIGRALGFAGYGIVEGIATADEMAKADPTDEWMPKSEEKTDLGNCEKCGAPNALSKNGNKYCSARCWLKQ
jgi:hypothetical protein